LAPQQIMSLCTSGLGQHSNAAATHVVSTVCQQTTSLLVLATNVLCWETCKCN